MADLLFITYKDRGHLVPLVKVAEELARAGHRCRFVCIHHQVGFFEENGMTAIPILAKPLARLRELGETKSMLQWLWLFRGEIWRFFSAMADELDEILAREQPDLCLVDAFMPLAAFPVMAAGMPLAMYHTGLPYSDYAGLPPVNTTRLPAETGFDRMVQRVLWQKKLAEKYVNGLLYAKHMLLAKMQARYRIPEARINRRDLMNFEVAAPQLILCSSAFDFPGEKKDTHQFVGPCISTERRQVDFPWARLDAGKKLILCGCSTAGGTKADAAFGQNLRRMLDTRPDWQLVVAEQEPGPEHPRIISVPVTPQLDLLKRADLMITHGGLNSVKECCYFGVPLLVLPDGFDQLGNAARVAYHGLGLAGKKRGLSAEKLTEMCDALLTQPAFRENMRLMQARLHADNEAALFQKTIDTLLPATHTVSV